MKPRRLRTVLQGVLLLLGVVAVAAGLFTVLTGSAGMPGDSRASANVESELRFYAVFWAAFGVLALRAARRPENEGLVISGLALSMFFGGLARALAWAAEGRPDAQFLFLMSLELVLPPLIVLAQRHVGRGLESSGAG